MTEAKTAVTLPTSGSQVLCLCAASTVTTVTLSKCQRHFEGFSDVTGMRLSHDDILCFGSTNSSLELSGFIGFEFLILKKRNNVSLFS